MVIGLFGSISQAVADTNLPEQISNVDVGGLFSNPFFLIPFIGLVGYLLYKQSFNNLVLIGLGMGVWIFSGSKYAHGLVVDGQIQADKVLPLLGVSVVVVAVIIYLFFGRSD